MKKQIDRFCRSLTARIFLITALILFAACGVTYGFIAWATPISYRSITTDTLSQQTGQLVAKLSDTTREDSGPLFSDFVAKTGADVIIEDQAGNRISFPDDSTDNVVAQAAGNGIAISTKSGVVTVTDDALAVEDQSGGFLQNAWRFSSISMSFSEWNTSFSFLDDDTDYDLTVVVNVTAVNQTVEAMNRVLPSLIVVVLAISLLGALIYSRYITRPIVRLSGISQKMAALDFSWKCDEQRKDEIGVLGQNLDTLSHRLSSALTELQTANTALQQDILRERESERQRSDFFAAASHELKTPITILKGQLAGMLAGVDVYQNRDKYLARSLSVTGRMEKLVQEMLTISRMERAGALVRQEPVNLSQLVQTQVSQAEDLALQQEHTLTVHIEDTFFVQGDEMLLARAISNLLTNALLYSPPQETVTIRLARRENRPVLEIENSGVHIPKESLPHLFDAFYRVEGSRSRETGGSGLGLYLVKTILRHHAAECKISNTGTGVMTVVLF